ncbi:Periplasmic dipeptide transport protein [Pandoraea horticolens]|uniref:Periplasmic dipeptide transport protein n=1 Tax=Pandoraea horticolens TaxID=2508298 RepID=A0A5E4X9P5_9BURK|nr:ABC transporter substrate-binding protein [Pandoraea horticolens]VVE33023.1 Periplasmic dipeptide transport protein [Pandoraea horticolens]
MGLTKILSMLLAAGLVVAGATTPAQAQQRGGVLNVATIGEPPTLDPMGSTADLVGMVTQHVFETLYTFDAKWKITPLLAQDMPTVSEDGLTYTIRLRKGVKFHDGAAMDAKDVIASLNRWMRVATRGKAAAVNIAKIDALDAHTIKITMKEPYAPLLSLLAFNNSAAVVMPRRFESATTITEPIGTGPYKFKERKVDQYINLVRFDGYKSRDGKGDGYGGGRAQYLDEIHFVPVPDGATRVEAAVAGQFGYTDSIPIESYARLQKAGSKSAPVLIKPFGYPLFVLNTKTGLASNQNIRLAIRNALGESDMLQAAFGDKQFFSADAAFYPEGYQYHTNAGTKGAYDIADPQKAGDLLKAAKYDGKPLRILTSRQYEFHYKMALVAAEFLKASGFKVDLQVVDWATLTQRRTNPDLWDIYITHSPFLPEPTLMSLMSSTSPGWWSSPTSQTAIKAFNQTLDPKQRVAKWAEVQKLIYSEVPAIKIGNFNALAAQSPQLQGVTPAPWPYFWNAWLKK